MIIINFLNFIQENCVLYITMILEGLKLMALGMFIVFIFLIALMILVIISARVFKGHAYATPSSRIASSKRPDEDIIAVLSAAITAYRKKNTKK